jgi:hypothetical protein
MGQGDGAGALRGSLFVEQHAAAAIDLGVEEARRQHAAAELVADEIHGHAESRHDVQDPLAVEQHRVVVEEALAGEDARAAERLGGIPHDGISPRAIRMAPSMASPMGSTSSALDPGSSHGP